jgi:hypothetical protein
LNYLDKGGYRPQLGEVEKLDVAFMEKELELLESMREKWHSGADAFAAIAASLPPSRSFKAERMAGLGRFFERTIITAINVKSAEN